MLLDRLMGDLHVTVGPFAMCEVTSGSRLLIGELGWVTLHFVLAGSGHITLGRTASPEISRYTLALVKRRHFLEGTRGDDTPTEALRIEGGEHLVGTPPGDPDFIVACGRIRAMYGNAIGIFEGINDPVIVDFSDSETMRQLFERILEESREQSEGSLGMIEALMRQCLVLLLRRLTTDGNGELALLEGLDDPRMCAVVTDVLDHPDDPHTVQSMASTATMSRSAFASRFRECFNETPMTFVRRTRLRRSAEMLRTTSKSVGSISAGTGFASRSHFSQVFSREFGITPSEYRQTVHDQETPPHQVDVSI